MKVLFIFPPALNGYGINESTQQPPLGIAYLAAILEKNGFTSEIIDANLYNYAPEKAAKMALERQAEVVCMSLYAFNFKGGILIADRIKEAAPDTILIAGGAQPSAVKEAVLKFNSIDAVCVGEGELTVLDVIRRKAGSLDPFDEVDGILYRRDGVIVRNNTRNRVAMLDELPFPALHLYPNLASYSRRSIASPAAPILTSRGCPYECIFCSKSVFGRDVRYRSAENVTAEIDYLVDRFKVHQIDIVDDNFITNRPRAIRILEGLCARSYRLAINLQSGVSAKLVDRDMLKLMKEAGVYRIAFGVESGNQRILDRIKKNQRLEDVLRASRLAKSEGIRTDAFFMIGLPGESSKTMQETIDFARRFDPNTANFHMAVPLPGTELYDIVKESGRLITKTEDGIESGYNYPKAHYEIGDLKGADVERYYKKAYRDFYFRPKKVLKTILSIKSMEEFLWLIKTGFAVAVSMLSPKRR